MSFQVHASQFTSLVVGCYRSEAVRGENGVALRTERFRGSITEEERHTTIQQEVTVLSSGSVCCEQERLNAIDRCGGHQACVRLPFSLCRENREPTCVKNSLDLGHLTHSEFCPAVLSWLL